MTSVEHMRGVNIPSLAAMEQTRMLANTLSQNDDPKFQVYMVYGSSTFFSSFILFYFLFHTASNLMKNQLMNNLSNLHLLGGCMLSL